MGGAQFGANFEFEFKVYLLEFGVVAVSFVGKQRSGNHKKGKLDDIKLKTFRS